MIKKFFELSQQTTTIIISEFKIALIHRKNDATSIDFDSRVTRVALINVRKKAIDIAAKDE